MILFNQDWNYYPTAVIHDDTKNVSWLRMARLYEKMGIKNNLFLLSLIDRELRGVDPFDPRLSDDLAKRIAIECRNNPWYFFREVARVPAKASATPWQFSANRGNIGVIWMAMNSVDVGYTQIRQTGKTLTCNELLNYCMVSLCRNTTMQLMTRSSRLRGENVAAIKEIRKLLPSYIASIQKDDADNSEIVTCTRFNNKILTALPQGSEDDARSSGRGFTSPIIMIDESAFCKNIHASYPAIMSSSNAASDEARQAGTPTFKLFPCTAGDKGSKEGRFMYNIYHGAARYREAMLDCYNVEELHETIRCNSRNRRLMVYVEFNHRQIGKSDAWLYEKIVESGGTPDEVNRDYFNQWTSGSGSSPFDREVREAIDKSRKDPVWVETLNHSYLMNWYLSKEELQKRKSAGVKFIAGMDSAEGIGVDRLTMVLVDEQTLETVGAMAVSDVVNIIHFSNFVSDFMVEHDNVILIPERKSTGVTIVDNLLIHLPLAGVDPFKRIFNRAVQGDVDLSEDLREFMRLPVQRRPQKGYDKYKTLFGYATTGTGTYSRSSLYDLTLRRLSNYASSDVKDMTLIGELMSLIRDEKGRIDHPQGGHDDTVIAWLLAGWLLNFGKNLSGYGITNPLLKVSTYKDKQDAQHQSPKDRYDKQQQEQLKQQMVELVTRLSQAEGDLEALMLEKQIRRLSTKLVYTEKLPMSIDELMREATNIRKNRSLAKQRQQYR